MRRLLQAIAWATLMGTATSGFAQPQTNPPDAVEIEFWRGAASINSAEAYRAYLERYPTGSFAPLAQIAQRRLSTEPSPLKNADTARPPSLAQLTALRAMSNPTGSLPFGPGARFVGPGVVSVGNWGATRQLLLPAGDWVTLAAFDHELRGFATVQLSTVAFYKVQGDSAGDTLAVTFNRTSIGPQTGSVGLPATASSWAPTDSCGTGTSNTVYHVKDSDMRVQWCSAIRHVTDAPDPFALPSALKPQLALSLKALGIEPSAPRYVAETHITERGGAFTSYVFAYQWEPHRPLLVGNLSQGDVVLPPGLSADRRLHVLQQAHFAYHAAMAHRKQYGAMELAQDQRLSDSEITRHLGGAP